MTPKEKAEELMNKFDEYAESRISDNGNFTKKYCSKQCALIAVDEILEETMERDGMRIINNQYWLDVKKEIENI